jgi:hypothetical protein
MNNGLFFFLSLIFQQFCALFGEIMMQIAKDFMRLFILDLLAFGE